MKLGTLYNVVQENVKSKKERKAYYWLIRELNSSRIDLGFSNNVDEVFDNLKEIFPYMISSMDKDEAQLSQDILNKLAFHLNKNVAVSFTYVAEHPLTDCDDDEKDSGSSSSDNKEGSKYSVESSIDDGYVTLHDVIREGFAKLYQHIIVSTIANSLAVLAGCVFLRLF